MSRRSRMVAMALVAGVAVACAGPAGGPSADGAAPADDGWASLVRPRPAPLADAPRIAVSDILVLGGDRWSALPGVSASVGLQELVSLGLLRRRDVAFVERRRFAAAVDRERRGAAAPDGAPPTGSSPGAELILSGTWAPLGADTAYLDLRLTDATTGRVVESWRAATPATPELEAIARTAVGGLLVLLDEGDRLPSWDDPLAAGGAEAAPSEYRETGVPREATAELLRGIEAEDRFAWEEARAAYERALELAGTGYFEADVALARTARLRAGGTLGDS